MRRALIAQRDFGPFGQLILSGTLAQVVDAGFGPAQTAGQGRDLIRQVFDHAGQMGNLFFQSVTVFHGAGVGPAARAGKQKIPRM